MKAPARFALTLALAGTLIAAGCKKSPTDASLTSAVQGKLSADSALSSDSIQASVQSGIATLNGTVDSDAARALAANEAAQVPGIRTVVNNLTVTTTSAATPPPPMPAAPSAPVAPTRPSKATMSSKPTPQMAMAPEPPAPAPAPAAAPPPAPEPPPSAPAPVVQAPPPPPPPAFKNVTLPAGTGISIRINQALSSATTQTGDTFSGTVASDVMVDDLVVIPHGVTVAGRVDDAKDATHYTGASRLSLSLVSIDHHGDRIPVTTDPYVKQGDARGKNTAEKVGGGAAVGAILGGIFGGGKGAAIGAAAGGGAGAGANTVTRGQQVQVPSESVIRFQLSNPVTVRVSLNAGDTGSSDGGLQHR